MHPSVETEDKVTTFDDRRHLQRGNALHIVGGVGC